MGPPGNENIESIQNAMESIAVYLIRITTMFPHAKDGADDEWHEKKTKIDNSLMPTSICIVSQTYLKKQTTTLSVDTW